MKVKSLLLTALLMAATLFVIEAFALVPANAAGNNPPSRVFIFATGKDERLWYKTFDGKNWGDWTFGGSPYSDNGTLGGPDACSPNPGEIIVFAPAHNDLLFYKKLTLDGISKPSEWTKFLPEFVKASPGAICRSGGRIDVFAARYTAGVYGVYHAWSQDDGAWPNRIGTIIGFKSLGGEVKGGPDGCSWGGKRLDVFARGTDNYIWHKYVDDQGTWHEWESLAGLRMTSDPSAVALTSNQLSVFARGENNMIWTKTYILKTDRWGPWLPLGKMVFAGAPDAARTADNRVDVFARGADGAVWHTSVTYKGGIPDLKSVPAWDSLGGNLSSDPSAVGVSW